MFERKNVLVIILLQTASASKTCRNTFNYYNNSPRQSNVSVIYMNKLITMDWNLLVNKLFIVLGISPEEKNDSTSLYQQYTYF